MIVLFEFHTNYWQYILPENERVYLFLLFIALVFVIIFRLEKDKKEVANEILVWCFRVAIAGPVNYMHLVFMELKKVTPNKRLPEIMEAFLLFFIQFIYNSTSAFSFKSLEELPVMMVNFPGSSTHCFLPSS